MRKLTISVAPNRFSTDWRPREVEWSEITRQLHTCKLTKETAAEYKAMPKEQRANVKDVGGFVGGWVQGARKAGAVRSRSLLTLDIDFAQADTIGRIRDRFDLVDTTWCLYSTHSHTPESPRYRLVIPLDRDVTPEEYVPIARKVAEDIGIDTFDDSTYEPHRLMYWPSCPKDGEFVYQTGYLQGDPLSADEVLGSYRDWRNVMEWPVSSRMSKALAHTGKKQEDPTTKGGVVGAFCRIYSISQAIADFLPDVYEPTAQEGRYTYSQGSTAGGLVVYEDKWAYSHHGTDPIGGREVNAFDLVRIHKYGDLDVQTDEDTKVTQLPSFKAMEEWCLTIPKVKVDFIEHGSSRQSAEEAFGDELPESKPDNAWKKDFHLGKHKEKLSDPFNFKLICDNDPGLKGTVKYDEFADKPSVTRDLPWRKVMPGDIWDDDDDKGLVWYISAEYQLSGKQAILDAHDLVIRQSSYHPVRDYLNSLKWDGVERLDTMLIDYLNAEDTPLVRAMTRKHLVAAVARVMRPGVKYDYALTLSGPEGIGKTTIIRKLGMNWYSNSFSSNDIGDKTSMEQVRGQWLIELGELVAVRKSTNEAFKNFITTDTDKFRPAYARKTGEFKRQCVFWATTNEKYFLKGDTGNRRFWTVYVDRGGRKDVFAMTQADVDQLWAEAVVRWKAGEELYLPQALNDAAILRAEEANEIAGDERQGIIEAFIRRLIPEGWEELGKEERAMWFRDPATRARIGEGAVRRKFICSQEIANECFQKQMNRYETREINQILNRLKDRGLKERGPMRDYSKAYGSQRCYEITPDFWDDEIVVCSTDDTTDYKGLQTEF